MPWVKSPNELVLREYPNLKNFLPYLDELRKESDRGQVLISTGYIEQILEDVLRAFVRQVKPVDDLFAGGNAPLGSFGARAKTCYALGLISDDEYQDLELIRRIRNQFAHRMAVSFDEPDIKDRCKSLRHKAQDYGDVVVGSQGQFMSAATALILNMVNRAHYVSERRLAYGNWQR